MPRSHMVQKCFWQMADSEDGTKSSEINLNENSTLMKVGEVGVELGVKWGWGGACGAGRGIGGCKAKVHCSMKTLHSVKIKRSLLGAHILS